MSKFDLPTPETAFVRPGTPMFDDLIRRIEAAQNLSPSRRRDLQSGLRLVAKALGRPPSQVPADPKWLRPRLVRITPMAIGLRAKSWSNILSNTRAALEQFGLERRRNYRRDELAPDWLRLWILACSDRTIKLALRRFVFFLNQQDVRPEDVTETHALEYLDALEQSEISRSPDTSYRAAINGWNLAVERLPDWPRRKLTRPSRRKLIQLPLEQFPAGFRVDLERYLGSLEKPDPFSPEGRLKPLRPDTIRGYRNELIRFASVIVHSGVAIEEIDSLAAILDLHRVEKGLRWRLEQNGGQTSSSISDIAEILKGLGRRYLKLPEEHQKEIERFASRLRIQRAPGLTRKNLEKLRPLDDPATLRRLLCLPEHLFARAKECTAKYRASLLRENAVAIAILLCCPIRRKNLAGIHLDRNVRRPGDGRTFLVFEPGEVKNERRIEFELPRPVVTLIDRHLAMRSPALCPPATPWLFPKRDGSRPMMPDHLALNVKKTILREAGLDFNLHLFRHLAAKLYLNAHPGSYEAVRRLLGHTDLSRTLNAYAGFEAGTATRIFADVVDKARRI